MSSFGSAVINKSNKKFAPKAPTQRKRPATAAPTQPVAPSSDATRSSSKDTSNHERPNGVTDESATRNESNKDTLNHGPIIPKKVGFEVEEERNNVVEEPPAKRRRLEESGTPVNPIEEPHVQTEVNNANHRHQPTHVSDSGPQTEQRFAETEITAQNGAVDRRGTTANAHDNVEIAASTVVTSTQLQPERLIDAVDAAMEDPPGRTEYGEPDSAVEGLVDSREERAQTPAAEKDAGKPPEDRAVVLQHEEREPLSTTGENNAEVLAGQISTQSGEEPRQSEEARTDDATEKETGKSQENAAADETHDEGQELAQTTNVDESAAQVGHAMLDGHMSNTDATTNTKSQDTTEVTAAPSGDTNPTQAPPEQATNVTAAPTEDTNPTQAPPEQATSIAAATCEDTNATQASPPPPVTNITAAPSEDTTATQAPSQPVTKKIAKPRKPRKTAEQPGEGSGTSDIRATRPKKPVQPRKSKKKAPQGTGEETQHGDTNGESAAGGTTVKAKITRKPRKKALPKTPAVAVDEDENGNPENPSIAAVDAANTENTENEAPQQRRKGRKREATPEGAEDIEINLETTTMFELCKDLRQGKKSHRESEFQSIDWTEVVKRRKAAEAKARAGEVDEQAREAAERKKEAAERQRQGPRGPQLRLINGQLVLDTDSLIVNRHAAVGAVDEDAVEETDLTKRINSQSWLYDNRRDPEERYASAAKSEPWSEDQTDQFYDAIRMFGTDFFIISRMFPGKSRRMIKNKFVREERSDPTRIRAALLGESVPMSMAAYCEATGKEESDFKNPEQLELELREQDEAQKADIEKQKAEQAERAKSKQEAAKAKTDASGAKKRKAKPKIADAGGEEVAMPAEGEEAVAGTAGA